MNEQRLAKAFGAIGLCLLLIPRSQVLAEQVQGETYPPVENASYHQVVFTDDDLAVINNLYPPGGDSGFHAHARDLFAVIIQPSESTSQSPGGQPRPASSVQAGTAIYSPAGTPPRVHQVINANTGTFQIIVVELRRASPLGSATSTREAAPQYLSIHDGPRLRAWRLTLQPGQSAPPITQGGKGVRVVVRGGLLTTTVVGVPDQTLALRPGDFAIQPAGSTRAVRNDGAETIELVEIELK